MKKPDEDFDYNPKTLKPPYEQIIHDRDALVRLHLANQRTVLSYMRTALTLFVAGVSFIQFFDSLILEIVGWAFVPMGLSTMAIGIYRYNVVRRRMRHFRSKLYGGQGHNLPG